MNIYLREMKANRKSVLFWCLGVILLVGSGMGKYTGMDASGQSITEIMLEMPKVVLSIFGMNGLDLNTAAGYYGVIFFLLLIMTAIHAAIIGASIISKEEQDRTSEFLFVKPVSRTRIITFKIFAAITNVIVLNLVSLLISLVMAESVAKGEDLTSIIINFSIATLIVQLIFLFIGTALASIHKISHKAAGRGANIVLITYVISVVMDFDDKLNVLKYFTPFKYFEPREIINGNGFEPIFVFLSFVIISLFVGITYAFFPKRDLSI